MKRLNFSIILIVILAFSLGFIVRGRQITDLEKQVVKLKTHIEEQDKDLQAMQLTFEALENEKKDKVHVQDTYWFWEAYDYPSSPEALLKSLENQNDLIPFEGVLGGTPFIVPGESKIIDAYYAYAMVEDGHMVGGIILRYDFINDKQVEWQLVDGWWPKVD